MLQRFVFIIFTPFEMYSCLYFVFGTQKPVLFPEEFVPSQGLMTFCLVLGGGSHYLLPKAIFRKDLFSLSWLETSDPHGRICMDPHLKANQGTNTLPISPRWGLSPEQEAQMKDRKKERRDRWLTSAVNRWITGRAAAQVPAPSDKRAPTQTRKDSSCL